MIQLPVSENHNLTPNQLSQEQDMLLLAGSKVSFRDIYNQEIELQLQKGKYYSAEDVDNLFVLINGIFTSVSEQAFRTDKALSESRQAAAKNEKIANQLASDAEKLVTNNQALQSENDRLKDIISDLQSSNIEGADEKIKMLEVQVGQQREAYSQMLESTSEQLGEQANTIEQLSSDNDALESQVKSLTNEISNIQSEQMQTFETGLQSELNVLKYKYESLKELSKDRVTDLKQQLKDLK